MPCSRVTRPPAEPRLADGGRPQIPRQERATKHLFVTAILAGTLVGCVGSDGSAPVTESADALHVSDLVMVNLSETDGLVRVSISCDASECTMAYEDDTETFDLDDWVPMVGDEPPEEATVQISYAGGSVPDFSAPRVDIAFTERTDDGADMRWTGIPVSGSSFRHGSGADRIEGSFYGPQAVEVGGIFERDQIIGAFGAKR